MKKLFLLVVLLAFAGAAQAQQAVVKAPDAPQHLTLGKDQAPAFTIEQQFHPMLEPQNTNLVRKADNILRKTQVNDLFEIGLMANTYAMIGDSRCQVACDPNNNNVAVIFRGNDRGSSDGNTLYIRYSSDHGATWTAQGDNIATTSEPRYPNIFLPTVGGPSTSVLWPQVIQFGDGSSGFGDVYSMKSDIGNTNPSYGKFSTPPNWSIPWQIIEDQTTGDLYSLSLALEPSNGASTEELFVLRSTDKGANWAPVTFDNPAYSSDLIPNGYFGGSLRFEISSDGSTMILGFPLIIESEPGRAFLLDENHEIAWRVSTDKGASWGDLQRIRPSGIAARPAPFAPRCNMAWDFDLTIDYMNRPHFLVVLSGDINAFSPFDDAPTDSTISLSNVDSTFASEVTVYNDTEWRIFPIGPVRRVRTDRMSFTAGSTDETATVFRNEPKWARSLDGKKIYAKWISSLRTWNIADVAGTPTLFADSIHNIYVNGRHVDSKSTAAWTHSWDYSNPLAITNAMDSVMRVTDQIDVDAKYTKIARYAGNDGQLHIIFTEWGVGETVDDDPVYTDQVVWYVQDAVVNVPNTADVEQIDTRPGDFTLHQNYPNPFNPSTEISFTLPQAAQVSLRVFNLLGQEVATLVNEYREAGTHRATFDASQLTSGMYIYRLESGAFSTSRKMMLSK